MMSFALLLTMGCLLFLLPTTEPATPTASSRAHTEAVEHPEDHAAVIAPVAYSANTTAAVDLVGKGYLITCLCMGQLGFVLLSLFIVFSLKHWFNLRSNQFDLLLGTLSYAKAVGRTLVLPFLFTYGSWEQSKMYPYESLFTVESVCIMPHDD